MFSDYVFTKINSEIYPDDKNFKILYYGESNFKDNLEKKIKHNFTDSINIDVISLIEHFEILKNKNLETYNFIVCNITCKNHTPYGFLHHAMLKKSMSMLDFSGSCYIFIPVSFFYNVRHENKSRNILFENMTVLSVVILDRGECDFYNKICMIHFKNNNMKTCYFSLIIENICSLVVKWEKNLNIEVDTIFETKSLSHLSKIKNNINVNKCINIDNTTKKHKNEST
jgi:hypothetical protein